MPRFSPQPAVALVGALALLCLAACGAAPAMRGADAGATATARAAATRTAAAQATQTARPVTISIQLAQRGTVAAHDVQLVATVTVANHTAVTIHLAGAVCLSDHALTSNAHLDTRAPPVTFELDDAPGHTIWQSYGWIVCVMGADQRDVQAISPGGTYTATKSYVLMAVGDLSAAQNLRAGTPYTVRASLVLWHQGTLDQFLQAYDHPDQSAAVLWGNDVKADVPFIFQ